MRERVRTFLGIWAPLILGFVLLAMSVNFLLTPRPSIVDPTFPLDPVVSTVCGGLLAIVGLLLVLSTYGRWRKARAARGPS